MAVFAAQHQSVSCDTLKMNQLCKVCGEPAAGFHFGAFTCEGCKSFFGRSYNNLSVISECKNGGQCVINKKNRTSCKACRLRKCLLVGMSKSGSRYGRRSNWFKLHCLMQEQGPVSVPSSSPSSSGNNNNNNASTPSSAGLGNPSPNSAASAAAEFHMRRAGFHHHHPHHHLSHHHMMSGLAGHQPSSMSSNESKDDADAECKNSSADSPSVSSPGSPHHSDSSLELDPTTTTSAPIGGKQQHRHGGLAHLGHHLNSFANLKTPFNPADFFPPLAMPMLPPHLAAAAAAAAANLHGFYPPGLPVAPRLLFPNGLTFPPATPSPPGRPVLTTTNSSHKTTSSASLQLDQQSRAAKKFNIESMLPKLSGLSSSPITSKTASSKLPADEQDSPMDLSVRTSSVKESDDSERDDSFSRGADSDADLESNESDTLNDDDDEDDGASHHSRDSKRMKRSHPLDLTRK